MILNDIILPPFLQAGDTVGVLAPASRVNYTDIVPGIAMLREIWGLKVIEGKTLHLSDNQFAGTDSERLEDLQWMLDNPDIKAIIAARGGYGFSRLLDRLDFTGFRSSPKWFVGFSDVTAMLAHLLGIGFGSLHGPMAKLLCQEGGELATESLRRALFGGEVAYTIPANSFNRLGSGSGMLLGGNLCLLAHLTGSVSEVDTEGAILFIEDVNEYLYSIDRMMVQLKRSGKLDNLSGLIVGQFTDIRDNAAPVFGKNAWEIVRDHVQEYNYPVCFDFPVGHVADNRALFVGARAQFEVGPTEVSLHFLNRTV